MRLQRFKNNGKIRRFDPAKAMGDIDGFGRSIARLPALSPPGLIPAH